MLPDMPGYSRFTHRERRAIMYSIGRGTALRLFACGLDSNNNPLVALIPPNTQDLIRPGGELIQGWEAHAPIKRCVTVSFEMQLRPFIAARAALQAIADARKCSMNEIPNTRPPN